MTVAGAVIGCLLKAAAFTYQSASPLPGQPFILRVAESPAVIATGSVSLAGTTEEQQFAAAFAALARARAYAGELGLTVNAAPVVRNRGVSATNWDFEIALPVDPPPNRPPARSNVWVGTAPHGPAVAVELTGPLDRLPAAYRALAKAKPPGANFAGGTWEQYLTDPATTPPEQQRTRLFRGLDRHAPTGEKGCAAQ